MVRETYLFLHKKSFHKLRSVDRDLFCKLVEALFNLVLGFNTLLLHVNVDFLELLLLLRLKGRLFLLVFLLLRQCDLHLELLLYLLVRLVLSFSVLLLKLFNLFVLLLLQLL